MRILANALLLGLLIPTLALAEVNEYAVDPVHSQVGFKIRHLVAKTTGTFADFSGTVSLDPTDVAGTLSLEATIMTASITTGNDKRDGHLKGADFFDVENHPEMTLVSKSVTDEGDDVYSVIADLMIRGVTQEVTLEVEVLGTTTSPSTETPMVGLDVTGKVDRQAFGISWNKDLDSGGVILGNTVTLDIHLEATVPAPEEEEEEEEDAC